MCIRDRLLNCSSKNFFLENERILFVGDSITAQGGFVQEIEKFVSSERPELNLELINAGLSSETVSGLSEPIHDPPRPLLFDRLDQILAEHKADWFFFIMESMMVFIILFQKKISKNIKQVCSVF